MATKSKSARMRFETWERTFKPQTNHLAKHGTLNGYGFETYGAEQDYAWDVFQKEPERVWTVIEGDSGKWYITNGWHRVNRVVHLVTELPCDRPTLEILYA